jgi:drug/metabolite transporter (DMT)-like permease
MWNLVFASLFGGESVSLRDFGYMGVALAGSLLLNMDPGAVTESKIGRKPHQTWGVIMGLVMALTESAMHTLLRGIGWRDPAKSVWVVNGSASAWLAAALGIDWLSDGNIGGGHMSTAASWLDAFWLTVFHGVSMFSGYWLRFFAVPRLSVVTYSILSYAGLLASYLFGMLFLGERPGWLSLLGATLIVASGVLLQTLPQAKPQQESEKEKKA